MSEDELIVVIRAAIWRQVENGYPYVGGEPNDTDDDIQIDGEIDLRELARAILAGYVVEKAADHAPISDNPEL